VLGVWDNIAALPIARWNYKSETKTRVNLLDGLGIIHGPCGAWNFLSNFDREVAPSELRQSSSIEGISSEKYFVRLAVFVGDEVNALAAIHVFKQFLALLNHFVRGLFGSK
jgi:hypothetical protein